MYFAETLLARSFFYTILATIDFFILLGSYGFLRLIHFSANWATWLIGSLIILDSALLCLSYIFPLHLIQYRRTENILGMLAFLIAVYAAAQWVTRKWYIIIKKQASAGVVQGSRSVLMFLRKHHEFFGWVIFCAALAHTVFFLPSVFSIGVKNYEYITGFITLGILSISVVLGVWMWARTRLRLRVPKTLHNVHALLTIAFFVVLFIHM